MPAEKKKLWGKKTVIHFNERLIFKAYILHTVNSFSSIENTCMCKHNSLFRTAKFLLNPSFVIAAR